MPPTVDAWDAYWQRTREAAAHRGGGPQEAVLERFWSSFLAEALSRTARPRLLDIASGNGALTRMALDAFRRSSGAEPLVFALDRSLSALQDLRRRFASTPAVVSDARRTPFADGAFDIIASQFGAEYAGPEAFDEAARLLAPGGSLAAVIHFRGGAIFLECAANLEAARAVGDSGILGLAAEVFRLGKAAERDPAQFEAFRVVEARFAAAVQTVDDILQRFGEAVAGGMVYRTYADIAGMYGRTYAYEAKDVADWCTKMASEYAAYSGRMAAMLAAAADEAAMREFERRLDAHGVAVRIREPLLMGADAPEPAAWALVCQRP